MQRRRTTRVRARPLRWDDAQIVAALLRTGSLLAAGKQLGLNASTVSRRLDALERATGGRLFDRSPEGVGSWRAIPGSA